MASNEAIGRVSLPCAAAKGRIETRLQRLAQCAIRLISSSAYPRAAARGVIKARLQRLRDLSHPLISYTIPTLILPPIHGSPGLRGVTYMLRAASFHIQADDTCPFPVLHSAPSTRCAKKQLNFIFRPHPHISRPFQSFTFYLIARPFQILHFAFCILHFEL